MKQTGNSDPQGIALEPDVELWAEQMSVLARSRLSGKITALVHQYEHASSTYLAVDMIGANAGDLSITFLIGQAVSRCSFQDLEMTCLDVIDMAQARHMADRLLDALAINTNP